jgi:murein DD-endopeptidase MepM/ murein hydrolase activator NlpD
MLHSTSTKSKIHSSNKTLSSTSTATKKANRKLSKIAKDMNVAENDILILEKKIDTLELAQEHTQEKFDSLKVALEKSEQDFNDSKHDLDTERQRFNSLLSEQFSIIYAMEKSHEPTRTSILSQEVYKSYKKQNTRILQSMRSNIERLKKVKEDKKYLRNKAKNKITGIVKKRKKYEAKKKAKEKLRKRLSIDEEKYNAKLVKLVDRQSALRSTLAKLNVLRGKEVVEEKKKFAKRKEALRLEKERKRRIRKEKALAREKAKKARLAVKRAKTAEAKKIARAKALEAEQAAKIAQTKVYAKSEKVRKVHSSYAKTKTYAYRGGKTISPLPGCKLVKRFGTYTDPIYKIKIFNESVTLKAPKANAKVQNILNGKVVFADKSSMLGNVVVIAHGDKIHTVYAGLSSIAPSIKKGKRIKKGNFVGRVASKLIFQATKNSKHINPMKLIRI